MNEKLVPIHDTYFAAFTILHKLKPQLRNINNRIAFVYPASEEFFKLAEAYYKVQDGFSLPEYVDCLKQAKTMLYQAKENGANDKR